MDYKKYFIIAAEPEEVYAALTFKPTIELWTGSPAIFDIFLIRSLDVFGATNNIGDIFFILAVAQKVFASSNGRSGNIIPSTPELTQ